MIKAATPSAMAPREKADMKDTNPSLRLLRV